MHKVPLMHSRIWLNLESPEGDRTWISSYCHVSDQNSSRDFTLGSLILQWDVLCAIANKHQPVSITITGAWKYISTNQEMNAWKQWTHLSWQGKMGSGRVTREWVEKMYSVGGDDKHDSVFCFCTFKLGSRQDYLIKTWQKQTALLENADMSCYAWLWAMHTG